MLASNVLYFPEYSRPERREHASDGVVQELGGGPICERIVYEESMKTVGFTALTNLRSPQD